jgi:hypothetical protein
MTFKKKLLILVFATVLLLAAALIFLWTNLDWIVKNAVERYGSQAAGTAVRVDSVALELTKGKGTVRGLTVANPKGFSAPHIMSLGGISVRVDPRSVASNPVVIDSIRVSSPLIVYEMNDARVANVDVLKKNLGADQPAKTGTGSTKGRNNLLRIRHLAIENAKVDVRIASLDGRTRTVTLPRLEMTDIGGKRGVPPDAAAREIVTAILSAVSKEVGKAGAEKLLEKALERALRRK